jgi:hypothetical protein
LSQAFLFIIKKEGIEIPPWGEDMWNSQPGQDYSELPGYGEPTDPDSPIPVPNKFDQLFFFLQPNDSPGTEGDAESSYIPLSSDADIWQMLYLLEYLKQSDTTAFIPENSGAYWRKRVRDKLLSDTSNTKLGLYSLNLGDFGVYGNGGGDPPGGANKCNKNGTANKGGDSPILDRIKKPDLM